jgi:hypothetical protein
VPPTDEAIGKVSDHWVEKQMTRTQSKVSDRLWLWAHDAGAHDESWGLPKPSQITPVEAASYLGIPNVIMVRYSGRPSLPYDQYAVPFRSMKQVVWSIVGAEGQSDSDEREYVLALAAREPNISGAIMDDFFAGAVRKGEKTALSLEQLRQLRKRLRLPGRRLDVWAVLYESQLTQPLEGYIELLDKLSFWTWDSNMLRDLHRNFENFERLAGPCGKLLGCYMWDYEKKKPLSLDLMQQQCEVGLTLLRTGRIEGMIFLASCICDLELDAVEWTRRWIAEVGDTPL